MKELVNELSGKAKTLRIDGYITHIQQSIRSIMGPVAHMWMSVAEERENLVATIDNNSEEAKAELERLQSISKRRYHNSCWAGISEGVLLPTTPGFGKPSLLKKEGQHNAWGLGVCP